MPVFHYRVSDAAGAVKTVRLECAHQAEVPAKLKQMGLIPLEALSCAESKTEGATVRRFGKRFDVLSFSRALSPLLQAHVQLARALSIMEESEPDGESREIIRYLLNGLHEGKRFSSLCRELPDYFPPLYPSLIAAGEESGLLAETLTELERFLTQRKNLSEFLVSNSIYPALVLSVTGLILLLLMFFVVPKFAATFESAGRALPWSLQLMQSAGEWIWTLKWLWAGLIILIIAAVVQVRRGGVWRTRFDALCLHIPGVRHLVQLLDNTVFFQTLGMLVSNNIHLLSAIRTALDVTQNRIIAESLKPIPDALQKGEKLSDTLRKSPYIPRTMIQLIRVGEESGRLGEMLLEVSRFMDRDMRTFIDRLIALFVPVMLILLGIVVATVVVSIFVALIQMNF